MRLSAREPVQARGACVVTLPYSLACPLKGQLGHLPQMIAPLSATGRLTSATGPLISATTRAGRREGVADVREQAVTDAKRT